MSNFEVRFSTLTWARVTTISIRCSCVQCHSAFSQCVFTRYSDVALGLQTLLFLFYILQCSPRAKQALKLWKCTGITTREWSFRYLLEPISFRIMLWTADFLVLTCFISNTFSTFFTKRAILMRPFLPIKLTHFGIQVMWSQRWKNGQLIAD